MSANYQLSNPLSPFVPLRRHYALVIQMAKRDVMGRYRGSFIGLLWSFLNPLFMLAIYTFVFGVIFHSRWIGQTSGHFDFAVILFAGLNINSFFSECANRAPTLIIENTNFVKKVVFPLETLSWSMLGSGLFHLLVSTTVLLVFSLFVRGSVPITIVLFPIVVLAFLPVMVGVVWLLASLGVFLRDLKQAIGVITTAMLFLAPVFYPITNIPPHLRCWMYLNPLTEIVNASRDVLVWGQMPNWIALGLYTLVGVCFAWASFAWFQRSRRGFADVL
jgi:lipopolysaccharide transport system permease protein